MDTGPDTNGEHGSSFGTATGEQNKLDNSPSQMMTEADNEH